MRRDIARLQSPPEIAYSGNLPSCNVFVLSRTVRCDHDRSGQLLRRNIVDFANPKASQKTPMGNEQCLL